MRQRCSQKALMVINSAFPRAFTLVELLIALVASFLVVISAVSFSRISSQAFSQESRIAAAQMAALAGFQRLQLDASRAGYMSTADMKRDYALTRVCAPLYDDWPQALQNLTSLRVSAGAHSDKLRISGNLVSAEMYPVLSVEPNAQGTTVYFQSNNGPMTRSGVVDSVDKNTSFRNIFRPGRLLRLVDQDGRSNYAIIATSSFETLPQVTTVGPVAMKGQSTGLGGGAAACGINGFGVGLLANPVAIAEYEVADLKAMNIALYNNTIFRHEYHVDMHDAGRTELVRKELLFADENGTQGAAQLNEDASRSELVTEYAVGFKVGLWASTQPGNPVYLQGSAAYHQTLPSDTAAEGLATTGPASVRALELRLSVRSRQADKLTDIVPTGADDQHTYRVPVGNRFARVRTLVATIALINQRGDAW